MCLSYSISFQIIFSWNRRWFELLMIFSSQTLFIMSTVRKVRLNKLFSTQKWNICWPNSTDAVATPSSCGTKKKESKNEDGFKKCFWNKTFLLCTNFLFCVFTKFSYKNVMFMFEKFLWEFWGWMTLFRKVISNNYSLNICKNRNMLINDINITI